MPHHQRRYSSSSHKNSVNVSVYSYNLLSTKYQAKGRFKECDENKMRDRKLWLENILKQRISHRAIFCLQEVSEDLSDHLQKFFNREGFEFKWTLTNNGILGEAIAFSRSRFEAIRYEKHELDSPSGRREQRGYYLFLHLRHKVKGGSFCVGTCHLPLRYEDPIRQLIHTGYVIRRFEEFRRGIDGLLAGDFNMEHKTLAYRVVTSGKIAHPKELSEFHIPVHDQMKSAYYEALKKEPRSTMANQKKTLDYIFCTPGVEVLRTAKIDDGYKSSNQSYPKKVCPSPRNPSDHVIIGSELKIPLSPSPGLHLQAMCAPPPKRAPPLKCEPCQAPLRKKNSGFRNKHARICHKSTVLS